MNHIDFLVCQSPRNTLHVATPARIARKRQCAGIMITACALAVMGLAGNPVWANGGNGGDGFIDEITVSGGRGGTSTAVIGGAAADGSASGAYAGGGGGSVSRIEGTGGSGGTSSHNLGGAGGAVGASSVGSFPISGGRGINGVSGPGAGASGGGGGGFGVVLTSTQEATNWWDINGGGGGNGGLGFHSGGGGGGEGGGGVLLTDTSSFINNGTISGGQGGEGGGTDGALGFSVFDVLLTTGNSGNGGDGGTGVELVKGGSVTNTSEILGGAGGDGGVSDYGMGGILGNGGSGISGSGGAVAITNSGIIQGGSGSKGGAGVQLDAGGTIINNAHGEIIGGYSYDDTGAAGIIGSNIAIINSGIISGGPGFPDGAAIEFTGGVNSLEVRNGSYISGIVNATQGTNTLVLGGNASNTYFGADNIGLNGSYQGFSRFQKTGSGTWTLGGEPQNNVLARAPATPLATPWTISEGTLAIRLDSSLGAASGIGTDLTFDGGTLKILPQAAGFMPMPPTDITMTRNIALASGSGTIDISASADKLTLNGTISGSGRLTKTGDGTLAFTGINNTYQGGTTISKGLVQVASAGAGSLGSGPVSVTGGTLAFGNTSSAASLAIHNRTNASTVFNDQATAGDAAITNDGALSFNADASLGTAHITNNALTVIADRSIANQASFINAPGGVIDIRAHNSGGASIGSLSGSGSVLLGSNTLTLGGLNKDETFNGVIADGMPGTTGGLTKVGTGLMILNGVNTYTGLTTVDGGTLEIGDRNTRTASIVGNVQVNPAGTLRGHGTVGGNVINNGTVRPGGSIGTLTIVGDYTQSEQGTLLFDISPTTASKLNVTGTATLAGNLSLLYGPGTYTAQTYHLLSANKVVGNFASVTDNAPEGLNLARQTGADFLNLEITGSGTLGPIIVRPTNATLFGAMGSVALREGQRVNDVLLNRLGRECGSPLSPSSNCMQTQRQSWMQVSGTDTRVDGNNNAPDYRDQRYGFLAGMDRPWGNWTVGVAGGYSHSDVTESDSNAKGKIDTLRVAGYAGRPLGSLNLAATVGYAHDFLSLNRPFGSLGSAKGDSRGQELHAGLQASAPLPAGPVVITPRLGLRYQYFHGNGFNESGPTSQNLSVDTQNLRSLQPYVGVAIDYPFNTSGTKPALVQARLGYAYETLGVGRDMAVTSADGTGFVIPGATDSRSRLTAGLGTNMSLGKSLSLYASYDALLKTGNVSAQTLQAGMNYRFF